jgi:hypothetical protein
MFAIKLHVCEALTKIKQLFKEPSRFIRPFYTRGHVSITRGASLCK